MRFTSLLFFAFAALTVLCYYLFPKAKRWWVLLVADYVFYFFAGKEFLPFILFTTLVTYSFARWMQALTDRESRYLEANRETLSKEERKAIRAKYKTKRRWVLIFGAILGFGMLAVLKYTGFVVSLFRSDGIPNLILPLGISFYTFQSMGYLIDVSRGKVTAEKNFFKTALFVSFFPQLVQGPISRFGDLEPQLIEGHPFDSLNLRSGLLRSAYGYFKKMVVADTAMIAVQTLAAKSNELTGGYVVLMILLYSIVIYGDFTGGIDIALGIAEMLGIHPVENFNRPFSSRSVKEYWNRWHITMGSWFTDYVFYPLSVSIPMQKLSKWSRAHLGQALGKRIPVYLATIFTWFLTGLWHGAGWNFIVWGLLNCLLLLVSQELKPLWSLWQTKFPKLCASTPWHLWQATRTFLLMGLIRSLDVYRNVPKTFRLWGTIFTTFNWGEIFSGGWLRLGLGIADYAVLAGGILIIFLVSQLGKSETPLRERTAKKPVLTVLLLCSFVGLILLFGTYGIEYNAGDFIYRTF